MMDPELYDDYQKKFLEPTRLKWGIESMSPLALKTPNSASFRAQPDAIDWAYVFPSQNHSGRMWLHSLGFISTYLANTPSVAPDFLLFVLKSYRDFLYEPQNEIFFSKFLSQDHCRAVRIRVMVQVLLYLEYNDLQGSEIESCAMDILTMDSAWGANAANLKLNNHGLMLAESLLHLNIIQDDEKNHSFARVGIHHIRNLLKGAIDDQGLTNENTIGYHDFYCKLLRDLESFLDFRQKATKHSDIGDFETFICDAHTSIRTALHKIVWPSGGIPPIGDSGAYHTKYPSIAGTHLFKDSGFFIHKSDDFYLSLICGCASETHKHNDDTSFTLRYKEQDVVIDSGMYHYDYNDPLRQCVQSQRGHSGIFFKKYDSFLRDLFRRAEPEYRARIDDASNNGKLIRVKCGYTINDAFSADREIVIFSEKEILICDSWSSEDGSKPVRRFIIPSETGVSNTDGIISLSFKDFFAWIKPMSPVSIDTKKGIPGPAAAGWASKKLNHIEPVFCFEITEAGEKTKSITALLLSEKPHPIPTFSAEAQSFAEEWLKP